jgi:hypothetical protein
MKAHAASQGFEVRLYPSGKAGTSHHGGEIKCWCHEPPPTAVKDEVIGATPALRTVYTKTSSRNGKQIKCGCPWSVHFLRHANGEYVITTRSLAHAGHSPLDPSALSGHLDSLTNVTPDIERQVRGFIVHGMRGLERERRWMQDEHKIIIDRDTYHNLIKKLKAELGIIDSSDDFTGLLDWLQKEVSNSSAVARMKVEGDDRRVTAVFYMSSDMLHHLNRNGQVMLMDTTFKTNRFHWPLLLVCGVDEHFHTVLLAIAVMHHQTTSSFVWALEHMRSAVSEEVWNGVASVFTDGDAAMSAAIREVLPKARHLRCRYHLEQNLRANLIQLLGVIGMENFITEWKAVVHAETEAAFLEGKKRLHVQYVAAIPYLLQHHWINERMFAECYIADATTLGVRSTARVESWNALLKGSLQVNSSTSLTILFEALQFAASDRDRRAFKKALDEAARLPPKYQDGTFDWIVSPHLTYYALTKMKRQFELHHNYAVTQKTVEGVGSVWYVWNRVMGGFTEKREVRVTDDSMHCTCSFPIIHLLPCRHVLALNLMLFKTPFRAGQVHRRWLKYYKPVAAAPLSFSQPPPSVLPSTVPTLTTSEQRENSNEGQREAKWGQLMGLCQTICTRGVDYKGAYHTVHMLLEKVSREVEAMTSCSGSDVVRRMPPSSSSTSSRITALHPTVTVDQLTLPEHRKKKRGREKERRVRGAGETQAKKGREYLSASQMT